MSECVCVSVCVCVCVCVWVCGYVCVCVCVHVYEYVHVCVTELGCSVGRTRQLMRSIFILTILHKADYESE